MSKAEPPEYRETIRDPAEMVLGAHFAHVDYEWRPYDQRKPDHREDYDRLFGDIKKRGIVNPLICAGDCVLIGMRRCEIARILGISEVPVWEITEDISKDARPDRVFALRDLYAGADY